MGEAVKNITNDRTKFIGGSDAPAVLGMSRWSTPLKIWALKRGEITEDISDRLPVRLGVALEDTVANLFMEETGKKVRRANEIIFHPHHGFIGAHIDRRVVGERAILECKTTSAWKAKEWEGEDIPREYIIQCLHYLAVTGAERCYLAVLIGNQDFKIKTIERDEDLLKSIIDKEVSFWNDFVVTGAMPRVILSHDADTLYQMFPQAQQGKEVVLPSEAGQIIEVLDSLKADSKNVDGLIEQKENELKALLQDADSGWTGQYRISWKNRRQDRVDTCALRKALPDVAAQFSKEINMRVFQYQKIEQGG